MLALNTKSWVMVLSWFICTLQDSKIWDRIETLPYILVLFMVQREFHSPVQKLDNWTFFEVNPTWTFKVPSSVTSIKTKVNDQKYLVIRMAPCSIYRRRYGVFLREFVAIKRLATWGQLRYQLNFRVIVWYDWLDMLWPWVGQCSCRSRLEPPAWWGWWNPWLWWKILCRRFLWAKGAPHWITWMFTGLIDCWGRMVILFRGFTLHLSTHHKELILSCTCGTWMMLRSFD